MVPHYVSSMGYEENRVGCRKPDENGIRPVRGMSAVVMGAGPAHACFFATYEHTKLTLGHLTRHRHDHIVHGLSGCVASLVHDAVSNPAEGESYHIHINVNYDNSNTTKISDENHRTENAKYEPRSGRPVTDKVDVILEKVEQRSAY
ncbi:Mitoferrin-1 [Eumeta japonica]|uniref:Mitoferrin-1 n=1 Tax=Eumeta variegata TaxID=151549 RepID=A0A4C1SXL7_EUMVA|nr:Mitoferrin-1 [Eumeta japonica]